VDGVTAVDVSQTVELSCAELSVREINAALRELPDGTAVRLAQARGQHNLAVGLSNRLDITISGNAGYFTGGLGDGPDITVEGFTGWSAGENLMSGTLRVRGNASESAGSSAHGGLIVIEGDASSRAGISLKGGTVAVAGDVGHMSGFMAQAGTMLIGGDAGGSLGDSLYEAVIYVAGKIRSLGADAQVEELTDADVARVRELAAAAGFGHIRAEDVTRVGSARTLYRFDALKDQRY
jgi:glutamate synthase domain-containing protein 3